MDYTKQQLDAINAKDKRVILLACAGSGKTSVIIERLNKLKNEGVNGKSILALTFSNKASKEMKNRLINLDRPFANQVNVRTFHALGFDLIKQYYDLLGFTAKPQVANSKKALSIVKQIMIEKNMKYDKDTAIKNAISDYKASQLTNMESKLNIKFDIEPIVHRYNELLKSNNIVDMDDMLKLPIELLNIDDELRKSISSNYDYIFVDEYQDTNYAQNLLLDYISNENTNLFYVGDDDQSIYEWRGADHNSIIEKSIKSTFTCLKLETNFRSKGHIIDVADTLIKNNKKRVKKSIIKYRENGVQPVYKGFTSEHDESSWIAENIKILIDSGKFNQSDIAVLYRNAKQIDSIKDALSNNNIAYDTLETDENLKFTKFIYVLKSIMDLTSIEDLSKALNFPNTCFDKFNYNEAKQNYCDEYGQDVQYDDLTWLNKLFLSNISFEDDELFRERYALIYLLNNSKNWTISQIISYYINYLLEKKYNEVYPVEFSYAMQVFDIAKNYEKQYEGKTLRDFIDHLMLTLETNDVDLSTSVESVNLLSIHRAKGLEFKVVFIAGVHVGNFPNDYFVVTDKQLEAERRLFYVAITRAKELLFISSFQNPLGAPQNSLIKHGFVAEIPVLYFGEFPTRSIIEQLPSKKEVLNDVITPQFAIEVLDKKLIELIKVKQESDLLTTKNNSIDYQSKDDGIIDDKYRQLLQEDIDLPKRNYVVVVGKLDVKEIVATKILKNAFDSFEFYDYDAKKFNLNNHINKIQCLGIILGPQAHKLKGVGASSLKAKLINAGEGFPFFVDLIDRGIGKSSLMEAVNKITVNYKQNARLYKNN